MASKKKFQDVSKEILKKAKEYGCDQDFLFVTTFDRYSMQLKILKQLEPELNDGDVLVVKEYVKGRENIYANPAIDAYNKTSNAANTTAATLLKIIANAKPESSEIDVIDQRFFK